MASGVCDESEVVGVIEESSEDDGAIGWAAVWSNCGDLDVFGVSEASIALEGCLEKCFPWGWRHSCHILHDCTNLEFKRETITRDWRMQYAWEDLVWG